MGVAKYINIGNNDVLFKYDLPKKMLTCDIQVRLKK